MDEEKARENNRLRQRKYIETHKEEVNEQRRVRYHERISSGKCPRCGGRAKKGNTLCADCRAYMNGLNQKYAKQNKTAAARSKAPVKKVKPVKPAKTTAQKKISAPQKKESR